MQSRPRPGRQATGRRCDNGLRSATRALRELLVGKRLPARMLTARASIAAIAWSDAASPRSIGQSRTASRPRHTPNSSRTGWLTHLTVFAPPRLLRIDTLAERLKVLREAFRPSG